MKNKLAIFDQDFQKDENHAVYNRGINNYILVQAQKPIVALIKKNVDYKFSKNEALSWIIAITGLCLLSIPYFALWIYGFFFDLEKDN